MKLTNSFFIFSGKPKYQAVIYCEILDKNLHYMHGTCGLISKLCYLVIIGYNNLYKV